MATKLNKRQNKFAKELFTKKYKSQKVKEQKAKVVLNEKNNIKYEPQFFVLF